MITAEVIEDAKVLVPNKDHKNFTESAEIIEKGSTVKGIKRNVFGLRKGEPFTYKVFVTDKKQIIYLNKIKPMEKTEVTLGADSQVSETKINMKPAENASRNKWIGAVIGAVAGFAFAKYKKHDMKKIGTYTIIGAALGFGVSYIIDRGKAKVTIKPSK